MEQMQRDFNKLFVELDAIKKKLERPNGWNEWAKHVLTNIIELKAKLENVPVASTCLMMQNEITRVTEHFEILEKQLQDVREELAVIRTELKTKASQADIAVIKSELTNKTRLILAVAAAIPAIVVVLWQYLKP